MVNILSYFLIVELNILEQPLFRLKFNDIKYYKNQTNNIKHYTSGACVVLIFKFSMIIDTKKIKILIIIFPLELWSLRFVYLT